jgi:hypothetical protein
MVPQHSQWTNQECPSSIPKGLNHSAQGWPIQRGLPWGATSELINPERVESLRLTNPYSTQNVEEPYQSWHRRHLFVKCHPNLIPSSVRRRAAEPCRAPVPHRKNPRSSGTSRGHSQCHAGRSAAEKKHWRGFRVIPLCLIMGKSPVLRPNSGHTTPV